MENNFVSFMKNWIQVLLVVIVVLISWGKDHKQAENLASDVEEIKVTKLDKTVFIECIMRIDASLVDIKDDLNKVDTKITKILTKE